MSARPIVGIDVDSVLFPINEKVILPAFERAGIPALMEDITDFDYAKCLTEGHKQIAMAYFAQHDLYDDFDISPLVRDELAVLRSQYRVLAVSNPFYEHAGSKWDFCYRAGFDHENIVLLADKALLKLDVLVDDRPRTCQDVGAARAVVFDQPWNRGQAMGGYTRAYGWSDLTRKVARLL